MGVFEMMADIESLIRGKLGRAFQHESWPILQALHRAHLIGRETRLSDLWVAADRPLETVVGCVEQLVLQGLVECDAAVLAHRTDGPVTLTPSGVERAGSLAEGIVETLTAACNRAGLDPFARRVSRAAVPARARLAGGTAEDSPLPTP